MFGAEAAQLVLGHQNVSTTEIYAEKNRARYEEIVKQIGWDDDASPCSRVPSRRHPSADGAAARRGSADKPVSRAQNMFP